jgi:hypothetical protein
MLHNVARLEAVRDRLNPELVIARRVDLNLQELKSWRNTSALTRKGGK